MYKIKKGKRTREKYYDLRITPRKELATNIYFRHESYKKITRTGYITICLQNNKLFFCEGDDKTGYKVSISKNNATYGTMVTRNANIYKLAKSIRGTYLIVRENGMYTLGDVR